MWDRAQFMSAAGEPSSWGWMHHSGWEWMMGLHGILWLAFVGLAVFAVISIIRSRRTGDNATGASAIAILDARYARGEIDRAEYFDRKRDLS